MSTDPASVGVRVLANLAAGRESRLAERRQRADELRDLVERAARLDRAAGRPDRGRPGRVARRLQRDGVAITERWTRTIISELSATSSPSASSRMIPSGQRQHPEP